MPKGMTAHVYRCDLGDCSNNGISSRVSKVTLIGPGVPEIFESTANAPAVMLMPGHIDGYRAVPLDGGENSVYGACVGPMFGGCFIYSSDSRFPSKTPIPLHDRWESHELYERNAR